MSERKVSEEQFYFENEILGAIKTIGHHFDIRSVQALREELRERRTLDRLGNTQKPNAMGSLSADQAWGCVLGLPKRAQGNVAQIAGVA